jgi:four helix bundle protein
LQAETYISSKMVVRNFKETKVYKLAYEQAMDVLEITKSFPKEEKYSLTDQVRRSSRSVCTNIAEAYRKKRYPAHFVLKVTDSDAENSETGVWFDFSKDSIYITLEKHQVLTLRNEEIGRLLNHMINNPDKY